MEPIELLGLKVYPYGLSIALAAGLGFLLMYAQAEKAGIKNDSVSYFALFALALCPLLARAGWCLASFGWVSQQEALFFFHFTRGGFMFYGALAGCLLAAWLTAKVTKQGVGVILDAAAAPAALTLCLSRLAENLVHQGFGRNIYDWFDPWMEQSMISLEEPDFFFRFPFGMVDRYGEWNWNIACLEAIAALVILVICLRVKSRRSGAKFCLGSLCYAAFQVSLESMRQDAVLRWGFVRVNQILSGVVIVLVMVCCMRLAAGKPNARKQFLCALFGTLPLMGVAMAMEFALEKKIGFLTWMRMDVCYVVMVLSCLMMVWLCLPLWRTAYSETNESAQ